nr:MAG TPA: hypothetical protein [Bacteriophage sp.]
MHVHIAMTLHLIQVRNVVILYYQVNMQVILNVLIVVKVLN